MWTCTKRHSRRGVLLLIVLALLTLFALITVTFVLVAAHHYRGAEAKQSLADGQANNPALLIDEGINQVLRGDTRRTVTGTSDPVRVSALQMHSLLEDKYGNGAVQGKIVAHGTTIPNGVAINSSSVTTAVYPNVTEDQKIICIEINAQVQNSSGTYVDATPLDYVGRVITFTSGTSAGSSRRIIGYNSTTNALQIQKGDWVSMYGKDGKPGTAKVDDDKNGTKDDAIELGAETSDDQLRLGDTFVINGPDFAGTGFGYNSTSQKTDALDSNGWDLALLPNLAPYLSRPSPPTDPTLAGGANEDYDAPDFQNMLLAQLDPNGKVANPSLHRPALVRYWIRRITGGTAPTTQADWKTAFDNNLSAELKHKIVLRPLQSEHPSFTGGNSNFDPTWDGTATAGYQWDVDNDKDGVPDSIWVDLGLEPITYDSKQYKPLFAILCVDLDGRLNVNTHGALAQTETKYYGTVAAPVRGTVQSYFADSTTAANLPRTIGFGPADINLGPLFGNGDLASTEALRTAYQTLLANQRYLSTEDNTTVPGISGPDYLSQNVQFRYFHPAWRTLFSLDKTWQFDYWGYWTGATTYRPNGYGSPIDLKAKGAIGLDTRGMPLYPGMNEAGDDYDHPYEVDLPKSTDADSVFSVADLERLLRQKDSDASQLPGSLKTIYDLATSTSHPTNLATELTTQSWDVPTPGMRLSGDLRTRLKNDWTVELEKRATGQQTKLQLQSQLKGSLDPTSANANLIDLLIVRLAVGLEAKGIAPANIPTYIAKLLPRLLPVELGLGLKVNVNRPFGNGLDDNGNGVVDEPARLVRTGSGTPFCLDPDHPGEIYTSTLGFERMPQYDAKGNVILNATMDHVNGIDVNALESATMGSISLGGTTLNSNAAKILTNRSMARQLYARQLYVLMLLLTDYQVATAGSPTQIERDEAKLIAQWAVNVVDYEDSDSIMTPFEYDICPFTDENGDGNTWDVDGCVDSDPPDSTSDDGQDWRGLVWGCERPELLITETLALHDRRTEDLAFSSTSGSNKKITDSTTPDTDFDQRFRPQGSLFVEIYNPQTLQEPVPAELYGSKAGVDLTRTSEGSSVATRSPVWRMTVMTQNNGTKDPDDRNNAGDVDRVVYFVGPGTATLPSDVTHYYYPNSTLQAKMQPIVPGCYALVGSGEPGATGTSTTYLGYRTDGTHGNNATRRIELNPGSGTVSPSVSLYSEASDGSMVNDLSLVNIQGVTPVIVNEPYRLSLTTSYGSNVYPAVDENNKPYSATTGYETPFDHPLDANSWLWKGDYAKLKDNGIFPKVWVIHLQRLANPLLPWDARSNPYLTIDTMSVDLNSFNGITSEKDLGSAVLESGTLSNIVTRQRGETTTTSVSEPNIWTQEPFQGLTDPKQLDQTTRLSATSHILAAPFHHTLGYLNDPFGLPRATPAGDPQYPFPWLRWANRPLVSPMELLEVPALGNRWLLQNASDLPASTAYPFGKTFGVLPSATETKVFEKESDHFQHLLNFAFSSASGTSSLSGSSGCNAGELYRLLDLVEVASPFPQEFTQVDPRVLAAGSNHTYYPPFNRIPNFRKPGLVNLNTVYSPVVWQGLINYFPTMGTGYTATPEGWSKLVASRRGIGPQEASLFPSEFANPFRSALNVELRPTLTGGATWPTTHGGVDATLLRPAMTGTGPGNTPVFEYTPSPQSVVTNTDRNPAFRYEVQQRLSNLTTTRSNLYAVWVTIGFFEVTFDTVDARHPDGYKLGAEIQDGTLGRHRSFYVVDRTVPVGFVRGQQLNVDKAIILRRAIE